MSYSPGTSPYSNPIITISAPLQPPPQQFTNYATLIQANIAGVMLFRNGLLQTEGLDYTRNVGQVTMIVPPSAGDILTAQVYAIGQQLGGATQQRYVAPWTMRLAGAFDGVSTAYSIVFGPTISGGCDSVNNLFTLGVSCPRLQVWRNGLLQTSLVDVVTGPTAIVFLPGAIPQVGDIITALGYPG